MSDSLGMELSKVLFRRLPQLLNCDLEASAEAAAEVSNLLGCIMATVLVKDPQSFHKAIDTLMARVIKSANETAAKSVKIVPNTTEH